MHGPRQEQQWSVVAHNLHIEWHRESPHVGKSSKHIVSLHKSSLKYASHHLDVQVTPPRRASRRTAGLVMPLMFSRRILRCLCAPAPFPIPFPPAQACS